MEEVGKGLSSENARYQAIGAEQIIIETTLINPVL
jgi:hypothetical protein